MRATPLISFATAVLLMGLAGVVAVTSIAWSLALIAPSSPSAGTIGAILPIGLPNAYRAEADLTRGDLAGATTQSRAELAISPLSQDAWVRLAEIDLAAHHRVTAEGSAALDHAYDARPYDLTASSKRLRLALLRFGDLPPGVQESVDGELAVWASQPHLRAVLQQLSATPIDPAGRLAVMAALDGPPGPLGSAAL